MNDSWIATYSNNTRESITAASQRSAVTTATVHANHQNTNLTQVSRNPNPR
jgi:hypothetical protein